MACRITVDCDEAVANKFLKFRKTEFVMKVFHCLARNKFSAISKNWRTLGEGRARIILLVYDFSL